MLDFYVKTRIRFSLRDKGLFEITEVEITRVNCIYIVPGGIRSLADVVMVSSTAIATLERVQDCAGNSCHIY